MERNFKYIISEENNGMPISLFLKNLGFSHHVFVSLKKDYGSVVLNQKPVFLNTILHTFDTLEIFYKETEGSKNILPKELPIEIVYEDDDIILINKRANMPVHPSIEHFDDTIANALMHYYNKQNQAIVFRCINRLDLDTTGLILIAKHAISGCILSNAMTNREIHREYLAIAQGMIPASGKICAPIARKEDSIIERCVNFDKGEYALTNFWRISYKDGYSLVKLKLETGRTHQIRVHMNYIGHPLPGDYLYNPYYEKINRQPLHSYKLSFKHPITKENMEFSAKLPEDFKAFIQEK